MLCWFFSTLLIPLVQWWCSPRGDCFLDQRRKLHTHKEEGYEHVMAMVRSSIYCRSFMDLGDNREGGREEERKLQGDRGSHESVLGITVEASAAQVRQDLHSQDGGLP